MTNIPRSNLNPTPGSWSSCPASRQPEPSFDSQRQTAQYVVNKWRSYTEYDRIHRLLSSTELVDMSPSKFVKLLQRLEPVLLLIKSEKQKNLMVSHIVELGQLREEYQLEFSVPIFTSLGKITDDEIVLPKYIFVTKESLKSRRPVPHKIHHGFYYSPEALKQYKARAKRSPTAEEIRRLMPLIKSSDFFPWQHASEGCAPRADLLAHFLALMGFEDIEKVYVMIQEESQNPNYQFNYHVAVKAKKLKKVLDPTILPRQSPVKQWIDNQANEKDLSPYRARPKELEVFKVKKRKCTTFTSPADHTLTYLDEDENWKFVEQGDLRKKRNAKHRMEFVEELARDRYSLEFDYIQDLFEKILGPRNSQSPAASSSSSSSSSLRSSFRSPSPSPISSFSPFRSPSSSFSSPEFSSPSPAPLSSSRRLDFSSLSSSSSSSSPSPFTSPSPSLTPSRPDFGSRSMSSLALSPLRFTTPSLSPGPSIPSFSSRISDLNPLGPLVSSSASAPPRPIPTRPIASSALSSSPSQSSL